MRTVEWLAKRGLFVVRTSNVRPPCRPMYPLRYTLYQVENCYKSSESRPPPPEWHLPLTGDLGFPLRCLIYQRVGLSISVRCDSTVPTDKRTHSAINILKTSNALAGGFHVLRISSSGIYLQQNLTGCPSTGHCFSLKVEEICAFTRVFQQRYRKGCLDF